MSTQIKDNSSYRKLIIISLIIVLVLYFIMVVLMNFVPPFMRDELTHHLFVPKLWIGKGNIFQLREILPSYYPMNIDLLYIIPLYFGNDIIPKFIHYSFGLGTAWLIFVFLKEKINLRLALLGALLFLSTPIIIKLSISAYVDLGLVFFSWATLFYLIKWSENTRHLKSLILSGIFCGLACGTKYNGLIVLLILTSFIPRLYLLSGKYKYSNQFLAFQKTCLFFIISIIFFSPWMIKNYVWTRNPIYPMFQNKITDQESPLRFSIKPLIQRKLIYKESPLETLLIPVRIFYEGMDNNPKYFDGKLNPFLLVFAMVPFFLKNTFRCNRNIIYLLGIYALLFLLFVYLTTDMRIRYIAPILPPVVVLSVLGINELINLEANNKATIQSIFRSITIALVIIMISINTVYLFNTFKEVEPIPYVLGKISKDTYLEKRLPNYNVIQYTNRIKENKNKILAFFLGNQGYYFDSNVLFIQDKFKAVAENYSSDESLVRWLVENRFTHIVVGVVSFKKWIKKNFNRKGQILVNEMFSEHLKLIYHRNGYALFEIKNKNV